MSSPRLIVTSDSPLPGAGSEPGKAFAWAKALSRFYEVHMICSPWSAGVCRQSGQCDDWVFHPLDIRGKSGTGLRFYWVYRHWCRDLIPKCLEVIRAVHPVGLHHPTLGFMHK